MKNVTITKNRIEKAIALVKSQGVSRSKYALARDADGYMVDPCSPNAVCYCALGALAKYCGIGNEYGTIYRVLAAAGVDYTAIYSASDCGDFRAMASEMRKLEGVVLKVEAANV